MDSNRVQRAARLWRECTNAKRALLESGFVRSFRATEADFAEWLVSWALDGELPDSKSHPGYDVIAGSMRVQVKSVNKMPGNPNGYIIGKRDRQNDAQMGATHYAFVWFDELVPDAVFLVPETFVREFPRTQIKRPDLEEADYEISADLSVFRA